MTVTISSTDLLNLKVGTRADGFLYELLDAGHRKIGTLGVSEESPPTITNDTTRPVFRTCSSLQVAAADLSSIDTLRDRIRIWLQLQNGATFPLGVYMFGDDIRSSFSWGTVWTPALFDETFIVDQPLDQLYGIAPGQSILSLVNLLVAQVGLPDVDFSGVPDQFAQSAVTYQAGSSRNQAITALIALLGCYPPYFDNSGTFTTKLAPRAGAAATLKYGSGGRIIDGTTSTTNSIYRAPNRYQVVGSSSGSAGYVGEYDLPASAPNSFANTGVRVVNSQQLSGIPSVEVANLAAYINALTDSNSYVQASFASTADPRHDTFELVEIYGVTMQEVSWSLECVSGGAMRHSLVGYYAQ